MGTELADAMAAALEKSSGPRLAARGGCCEQTLYNIRDGHLPGRLAIPAVAKALNLSAAKVAEMVARDRSARGDLHGTSRNQAGVA